MTAANRLEFRLPAIRVVDSILATLQAAFADPRLFGNDGNPMRFIRGDPKGSRVWVCDPESRVEIERDGSRMMVMVSRGDYIPRNQHLAQFAGGNGLSADKTFTDVADCPVFVDCEAGNKMGSETLGSVCYLALKQFHLAIMSEYDLTELKLLSIAPPMQQGDAPGSNWVVRVAMNVAIQEFAKMSEIANLMNTVGLNADVKDPAGPRPIMLPTEPDPAFPDRP